MTGAAAPYQAEEHWVHVSRWIRIRARGAEWSRLTDRLSTMEVMAASLARISPARTEILGLLLGAACPVAVRGRGASAPLWTDEAMHRAYYTRVVDSAPEGL